MSVHDAEPWDVYVDSAGKLWRCVGICREPTVIFEEVEGRTPEPRNEWALSQAAAMANVNCTPAPTPIIKDRKAGGVTGLMWQGWKRIYRKAVGQACEAGGSPQHPIRREG